MKGLIYGGSPTLSLRLPPFSETFLSKVLWYKESKNRRGVMSRRKFGSEFKENTCQFFLNKIKQLSLFLNHLE